MNRGRPREFDRDEALDKAVDLFWEKTYESIGVAELARHMGIGRQSLYDTYGNKEELFLEALSRYLDREIAPLRAVLQREGSPLGNLHDLLALLAERTRRHAGRGCLMVTTIVEHGPAGDRAALLVRDRIERIEAGFRRTLEQARDQGELDGASDPEALAALLVVTMFGMTTLARLGIADALMPKVSAALGVLLQPPA